MVLPTSTSVFRLNPALVEESAAAAASMSQQAQQLLASVQAFKTT